MSSDREQLQGAQVVRRAMLQGATALSLFGGGLLSEAVARANSLRVNEPAPPAMLVTLDGQHVTTTDLLGKVVILTFWATWCVPCRDELPLLSDFVARHEAQGLRVLAFSLDAPEDLQRVREVASSWHFPVGLLANSSVPGYGRIWRIPVNFTIDRQGLLIDNGWKDKQPTWTAERLEQIVTPLLAAAP